MVGHKGSSAGSYLADPTSPIPSHCASIVATSTFNSYLIIKCTTLKNYFLFAYFVNLIHNTFFKEFSPMVFFVFDFFFFDFFINKKTCT